MPEYPQLGQRISIVGSSGSGKTTLALDLVLRLGYPRTELDQLNWGSAPSWQMRSDEDFRRLAAEAAIGDRWVIDGNYRSRLGNLIWDHADTIIWLDYALPLIMWRLWWRIWRRTLTREVLWGVNVESLWTHLFTKDSLFLWALQTYSRRRREYTAALADPTNANLTVIHFQNPRQTRHWLDRF